jgi:broad specificity phosphatase PhoE
MNEVLPTVYLARHGETAWSISSQHTGLTDLPLTERGERNARSLKERLSGLSFAKVFTSPLQRVTRTCELAGFGDRAEIDRDLVEWDYGDYEGRRTPDIHKERPDWQLFYTCWFFPVGTSCEVFAARWLGLEVAIGRCFILSTASLSAVSYEHKLSQPAIRLWDDTRHVAE